MNAPYSKRFPSIDVFRAITMFLMIFVNDVSGFINNPCWIDHAAYNDDRLGLADTIFPAFLFIAGLSLPLFMPGRMVQGYRKEKYKTGDLT